MQDPIEWVNKHIADGFKCYSHVVGAYPVSQFLMLVVCIAVATRIVATYGSWDIFPDAQSTDEMSVCGGGIGTLHDKSGRHETADEPPSGLSRWVNDESSGLQREAITEKGSVSEHTDPHEKIECPHLTANPGIAANKDGRPTAVQCGDRHTSRSLIDIWPCHQSGIHVNVGNIRCHHADAKTIAIEQPISCNAARRIPATWMILMQKYKHERERLIIMIRDEEKSNACKEYPWEWDVVHQVNFRARLDAFSRNGYEPACLEHMEWSYRKYRDFACTKPNDEPCFLHSYMRLECIERYFEEDGPLSHDIGDQHHRDGSSDQRSPHVQSINGIHSRVRFRSYDSFHSADDEGPHNSRGIASTQTRSVSCHFHSANDEGPHNSRGIASTQTRSVSCHI